MRAKMPPDRPGKLNPQTYADLTAFLLANNGFQPGPTELPPDPPAQAHMDLSGSAVGDLTLQQVMMRIGAVC